MTKRIFFDIDGVLIDGFHAKPERRNRWDAHIEQDLGIKPAHFQEIFNGWFLEVLQGRLNFQEEMGRWLEVHGYDHTPSDVIDYWHSRDTKLSPAFDVVTALSGRDGVFLYTATNQSHERIQYLKDELGWKDHFTDFYYSARLGCLKYDSRYFRQIEEELEINPHIDPPLYFDDDPRNIEVSSARGWNAVLVDGPDDITENLFIEELLSA